MRTGKENWHVEIADFDQQYFSTMAPVVIGDQVLVGTGNDLDAPGFLQSYDPRTGALQWKTYMVPMNPGDPGLETWPSLDAARHGGGQVWMPGSYDPETGLYITGTGNPTPGYTGIARKGDNLFTCSLVAIDVKTGKMAWYYQTSPHDTHDWDSAQTPVLFDGTIDGKPRKLVSTAARNGYFFTLDRVTGEHIVTSKFGKTTNWAKGLRKNGAPEPNPAKEATIPGSLVSPFEGGVTNWQAPAFNPELGLFYVHESNGFNILYLTDPDPRGSMGLGGKRFYVTGFESNAIQGIDYRTGKPSWRHEWPTGAGIGSGMLTTATGLLFTGDGSGNFVAMDAASGELLWHTRIGNISNAPQTYEVNGRQYLTGGRGRHAVFLRALLMQPRIRYGMVGGGEGAFIGAVHRMAARLDDQFELVCGAFSSNAERALQSGAACSVAPGRSLSRISRRCSSARRCCPRTGGCSASSSSRPIARTWPIAAAALDTGFHVLSDKPATATLAECRELAAKLRAPDCSTDSRIRTPPTPWCAKRASASRAVNWARSARCWWSTRRAGSQRRSSTMATSRPRGGWIPRTPASARCMGDIGVHAFNLAEFVTGLEVRELCASLNSVVPGRRLDDDGTVLLRFDNGASGVLVASQVCAGDENNLRLRVYGEEASLDWQQMEPNSLWLRPQDAPAQLLRTGVGGRAQRRPRTRIPAGHPEGYPRGIREPVSRIRAAASGRRTRRAPCPASTPPCAAWHSSRRSVASSAAGDQWLAMRLAQRLIHERSRHLPGAVRLATGAIQFAGRHGEVGRVAGLCRRAGADL